MSNAFEQWTQGCGVITHSQQTVNNIQTMASDLVEQGLLTSKAEFYEKLIALDILTNQAMWLVVHMSYCKRIDLSGNKLSQDYFKREPQGHTGGSLNMVPAYMGKLALNNITQTDRPWLMGQGHCVAAIDASQMLMGIAKNERRTQYPLSNEGLSQFVADFYHYEVNTEGSAVSTLGSHVNVHTQGARIEGGYLGFAGLQYIHQSLPGENWVAFLSDGAFEEQRGSDWAARWWRESDSGLVSPIMIANGRRIDQRTTVAQQGGSEWFKQHLIHQGFDPFIIDGRDPAAFVWAIYHMEKSLTERAQQLKQGNARYPVRLPYCIAETEKGFGFPGVGSNAAHGLPLPGNPRNDAESLRLFHEGAHALFQPQEKWQNVAQILKQPQPFNDNWPTNINLPTSKDYVEAIEPMAAIDETFVNMATANPNLRIRVGNPDELRSNRMNKTLDTFKHRVTSPEPGIAEAIDGCVITALNEEAIVTACLGNQRGLNIVISYEAFSTKMFGALRQSIIFSRHQKEANEPAQWISLPVVSTSHTWENGKNEQSHQDPSLAESLLGEMSDMARVIFPADGNTARESLLACYKTRGTIFNLVTSKSKQANFFTQEQAAQLVKNGAIVVRGNANAQRQIVACGSYQLEHALRASDRLQEHSVEHSVVYVIEPGRFRIARDKYEEEIMASSETIAQCFPTTVKHRIIITHTRPEVFMGHARRLDLGPINTRVLGYINRGGTLDTQALMYANKCTWAHCLAELASMSAQTQNNPSAWLTTKEFEAINGQSENGDPYAVIEKPYPKR